MKNDNDVLKKKIRRIIDKSLQEMQSNHRMVGKTDHNKPILFLWQPHNYRLYFDFNKDNFNPKKPPNHTLRKYESMVAIFNTAYTYTPLNYDSEHKYDNFMFCQIRVKKNQVEVINKWHNKQWRKVSAGSIADIDLKIDKVMDSLKNRSIEALKAFIDLHGGRSGYTILNERCEHGIHGDDYLDKIPKELVINDTYFKKTYKKKPEFKKTTAIKNYITNRAIESIAPEISTEIGKLADVFSGLDSKLTPAIDKLTEQIELHLAVQKNTQNVLKSINKGISEFRSTVRRLNSRLSQKRITDY